MKAIISCVFTLSFCFSYAAFSDGVDSSLVGDVPGTKQVPLESNQSDGTSPTKSQNVARTISVSPPGAAVMSPSRSIIKVMGALLVVLVAIFGVATFVKKMGISRFQRSKQIIVRESISVGAKEKILLVDFSGESLLLGVAPGQVNLLKSVPQLRYDSSDLPAPHLGARNALDFQQKLNEFLIKGQK